MTKLLPLLPLRDIVVFPGMVVPLFVGRDKSVAALEASMAADDKEIFLLAQLDPGCDDPDEHDLYDIGVIATVLQLLKLPDGTVRVLVEAKQRASLESIRLEQTTHGEMVVAQVTPVEPVSVSGNEVAAMMRSVVETFGEYAKLNKKLPAEAGENLGEIVDAAQLADAVASHIQAKVVDKQALLSEADPLKRLEMAFSFMEGELGVLQVERRIRGRVKRQMEKTQREYYLNEQLKAIQSELGGGDDGEANELQELQEKIDKLKLSKEARAKANAELKKLKSMQPMSAEATVIRNYLDVLLGLPWGKKSKLKRDIAAAQAVLDADHYALDKVKDRIVEYLAVQARTNQLKGPILCLVGPPGVGKTSLGKSIAKATGRQFVRQSLGGVRDEAEIRGHRRTYIGSLPGKIVTNLKKAGTANPLFLLDEIDKLGQDFRGDPASALLEVLDPEQNAKFQDHYLELDLDLSDIMFVCTANSLNLPHALLAKGATLDFAMGPAPSRWGTGADALPPSLSTEGQKPAPAFVPERQPDAGQAIAQRDAADAGQLRMVFQDLGQAVVGDAARQMVHMVDADIAGEPAQRQRQVVMRGAVQCGRRKLPVIALRPVGLLELVLDIEQPDADGAGNQHGRQLHRQEQRRATQPERAPRLHEVPVHVPQRPRHHRIDREERPDRDQDGGRHARVELTGAQRAKRPRDRGHEVDGDRDQRDDRLEGEGTGDGGQCAHALFHRAHAQAARPDRLSADPAAAAPAPCAVNSASLYRRATFRLKRLPRQE